MTDQQTTLPALVSDSLQMELWKDTINHYGRELTCLRADTDHKTRREVLKQANKVLTDFDEIRKAVGKPYRERIEQINELAKQTTRHLAALVEQERKVLASQLEAIEAARRERERQNAIELAKTDSWSAMPVLIHAVPPKPAGSALVWDYEVTDFSLIPDEYKMVNPKAIAQALRQKGADGLPGAVPGVKFYQKMQTRL